MDLSDALQRPLNRGLNFSILPFKLDITQTLVEFRNMKEHLYGMSSIMEVKIKVNLKDVFSGRRKQTCPPNILYLKV